MKSLKNSSQKGQKIIRNTVLSILSVLSISAPNLPAQAHSSDSSNLQQFSMNDPQYLNEWHLGDMHVPGAWRTTMGMNAKIALIGPFAERGAEASRVEYLPNFVPPPVSSDMGTQLATLGIARHNNGRLTVGVAPEASVLNLPVDLSNSTSDVRAFRQALQDAQNQGAKIVVIDHVPLNPRAVNSSNAARLLKGDFMDHFVDNSQSDRNAVWAALQAFRDGGGLILAGAGYDRSHLEGSTMYQNFAVTFVSGHDRANRAVGGVPNPHNNLASTQSADLAGQRYEFFSTPARDLLCSDARGNLRQISGTGVAAMNVAGVAALVQALNPQLSGQDIKRLLFQTADPTAITYSSDPATSRALILLTPNAERAVSLARSQARLAASASTTSLKKSVLYNSVGGKTLQPVSAGSNLSQVLRP